MILWVKIIFILFIMLICNGLNYVITKLDKLVTNIQNNIINKELENNVKDMK